MKKFAIFGLGLLLLSGSFVFIPEATREAYQNYLDKQILERRSLRRFSSPRRKPAPQNYLRTNHYSKIRRNSYFNNYNEKHYFTLKPYRTVEPQIGVKRTFTESLTNHDANKQRKKIVIPKYSKITEQFKTVSHNSDFSIRIPEKFSVQKGVNDFSVVKNSTANIRIKKFDKKCYNGFTGCAINLSKGESNKNNLYNTKYINRNSANFSHINKSFQRSKFYEESFLDSVKIDANMYIRRFIGTEKTVYMIEMSSKKNQAKYLIPLAKKVMDSFRVKNNLEF